MASKFILAKYLPHSFVIVLSFPAGENITAQNIMTIIIKYCNSYLSYYM